MEFNEKLQALRREQNMTQEELAKELFVSRTAVSKWESGRGYPNIDSLRAIAKFFSVSVDELISDGELLKKAKKSSERGLMLRRIGFCVFDILALSLVFLPLFRFRAGCLEISLPLISVGGGNFRGVYLALAMTVAVIGALNLVFTAFKMEVMRNCATLASVILGCVMLLALIGGGHVYASAIAFVLLACKSVLLIKR